VIRLLTERQLAIPLDKLLRDAAGVFGDKITDATPALSDFIYERLAGMLREQGATAQQVDAVLSLRPKELDDVGKKLAAVRAFAALPESGSLAAANKRVSNILKKADGEVIEQVDAALLTDPAEQALHAALVEIERIARPAFDRRDFTASLQALAALKAPVDAFFDQVMVNADDPKIRVNRLGLLAILRSAMNRVADLSRLAV
jgi:glycyl-tRNA synthetase beta chain